MSCQEWTDKIIDWLEGELDADEARQVREHVESCVQCAAEAESIRQALDAVKRPARDPGEAYFETLYSRIHKQIVAERQYVPWTVRLWQALNGAWLRPAAVTATALLIAAVALVGGGVLDLNTDRAPQMDIAGVSMVKKPLAPTLAVTVNPQLKEAVALLDDEQVAEFETQITEAMMPEDVDSAMAGLGPLTVEPSFASLSATEMTELADRLAQVNIEMPI
ncbi:MAG TPA: zf-HC2 domain-containing protein [bacterium]|mgnify:FL=1|nr:zf-HC2 domain-containing protein [bacterium]